MSTVGPGWFSDFFKWRFLLLYLLLAGYGGAGAWFSCKAILKKAGTSPRPIARVLWRVTAVALIVPAALASILGGLIIFTGMGLYILIVVGAPIAAGEGLKAFVMTGSQRGLWVFVSCSALCVVAVTVPRMVPETS